MTLTALRLNKKRLLKRTFVRSAGQRASSISQIDTTILSAAKEQHQGWIMNRAEHLATYLYLLTTLNSLEWENGISNSSHCQLCVLWKWTKDVFLFSTWERNYARTRSRVLFKQLCKWLSHERWNRMRFTQGPESTTRANVAAWGTIFRKNWARLCPGICVLGFFVTCLIDIVNHVVQSACVNQNGPIHF